MARAQGTKNRATVHRQQVAERFTVLRHDASVVVASSGDEQHDRCPGVVTDPQAQYFGFTPSERVLLPEFPDPMIGAIHLKDWVERQLAAA